MVLLAGFFVPRMVLAAAPDGFVPGTRPTAEERAWTSLSTSYEGGLSDLLITGYSADVAYCADGQEPPALAGHASVRTWWFLPLHRRSYDCS